MKEDIHSFNMRYGGMPCSKRLQKYDPSLTLNNSCLVLYLIYCYPSDFGNFHFNTSSSGTDSSENGSSILNIDDISLDDIYDTFSSEWDQGLEVNPVVFYSMVCM